MRLHQEELASIFVKAQACKIAFDTISFSLLLHG